MTTPHAVISGASIAGLSTAWWLRRIGWQVTVVERAESFREGGQNVDVRGVAHQVLDRMGLTEAVKELNTTETGTVLVDADGAVSVELPADGADGATAELEILRGDLARVIRDHLPEGVEFVYGDTIAEVAERVGGVKVTTASGLVVPADLLVIAEGVRSVTRDRLFGAIVEAEDLDITMVFGTIERTPNDDDRWRWYNAVGGRQVHLRPDSHGTTRAILAYAQGEDLTRLDRRDALVRLRARFADAGWEAARVLDGFDVSDDVYVDRLTQIRMPSWSRGRVCLVGDAAWCVTPLGGGGASLALTGGYVLAAYLSTAAAGRLDQALDNFERWMRPLVDDVQRLPPGVKKLAYPQTALGLKARGLLMKAMTSRPLSPLTAKLTQVAETDQSLPELAVRPAGGTTKR